eukprot:CAMPEP_0170843924 /NCGR_PEP_ID=MMETSP0734-20130129/6559_1 /TAXON_ID=186038 /ORGANISM="Fragilariopsis kerguelensis, Strain L26-C5" /LENGTH=309 /DNA_ID=CAMNT_0011212209 /DNA_START=163 /DNA_END=1089 /DNA_ORIENTATION=+
MDYERRTVWYPTQSSKDKDISLETKLLKSSIGADVEFLVDKGEKAKTFHGHSAVLAHSAPVLYNLVVAARDGLQIRGGEVAKKEESLVVAVVEITNISSSSFERLLEHLYTGNLPTIADDSIISNGCEARSLLLLADQFSCEVLKLHLESEIIVKLLEPENLAEWLLFADRHALSLLKESCMGLYVQVTYEDAYGPELVSVVKASPGWSEVMELPDLLVELLDYCACTAQRRRCSAFRPRKTYHGTVVEDDYDIMPVYMLREKLEERHLSLDGKREVLINRLRQSDWEDEEMSAAHMSYEKEQEEEEEE